MVASSLDNITLLMSILRSHCLYQVQKQQGQLTSVQFAYIPPIKQSVQPKLALYADCCSLSGACIPSWHRNSKSAEGMHQLCGARSNKKPRDEDTPYHRDIATMPVRQITVLT